MTTYKRLDVMHLVFGVGIMILVVNLLITFNLIDLIYLLFVIGCYIRFIFLKIESKKSQH